MLTLAVAQQGWISLVFLDLSTVPTLALFVVLIGVEVLGPVLAEEAGGTPWNPHHIAERYSLLAIIALGEGVVGTVGSVQLLITDGRWSADAVLLVISGVGLTFGMWWTYFFLPSAEGLRAHRERSFGWGYGHMPVFWAIAAVGAGLHVVAYYLAADRLDFTVHIGAVGAVLAVAVPLAVYLFGLHALYVQLTRSLDRWQLRLLGTTAAILALVLEPPCWVFPSAGACPSLPWRPSPASSGGNCGRARNALWGVKRSTESATRYQFGRSLALRGSDRSIPTL